MTTREPTNKVAGVLRWRLDRSSLVAFYLLYYRRIARRIDLPEHKIIKKERQKSNQNDKREGGCRIKAMKIATSTNSNGEKG